MKNKKNLLLTISLTLFMINCSGKANSSSSPQVHTPSTPPLIRNAGRTLGTIITRIPQTIKVPQTIKTPQARSPRIRQISSMGKSYVRKKFTLPNSIKETSGLIKVDNRLWTLNDSGGKAKLYQIDEQDGRIVKTLSISNAQNTDWEDIAYDDTYVYIADVGNNRGNRRDLKVYKIPRAALRTQSSIRAEIINFSYSDQKDFTSRPHKNNYDCEAMIAYNGTLYLFSKNWQDQKTRLYSLSSNAGKHTAKYVSTFNIQGMVTGASINHELGILLLTTYSSLLDVNVWAFTNHNGHNFFQGDVKRLNFSSPLQGQIEGITFKDNHKAYLSSEAFKKYIFSLDASLYEVDFRAEFE